MGAIVAAAYALNPDWHNALLTADAPRIPRMQWDPAATLWRRIRSAAAAELGLHGLAFAWGLGSGTAKRCKTLLQKLTLGRSLEEASPVLSVIATDLLSGRSIVLSSGNAGAAVYASSALAGMLPPLAQDDFLLADGGYTPLPPLRSFAETPGEAIIMVDPDRYSEPWAPNNGLQAMIRAAEVAMQSHARHISRDVDLILCPRFPSPIDAFDFTQRRSAQAAGLRAVRRSLDEIKKLLGPPPETADSEAGPAG